MNRNELRQLDSSVPTDTYRLGIDVEGTEHWHSARLGRIWLVDGDDVDTRELDGRPVSEWVAYVRSERGWESHHPVHERNGLAGLVEDVCEVA